MCSRVAHPQQLMAPVWPICFPSGCLLSLCAAGGPVAAVSVMGMLKYGKMKVPEGFVARDEDEDQTAAAVHRVCVTFQDSSCRHIVMPYVLQLYA